MVLFKSLLDRPNGKEWPEIDIDYNSLQNPRYAVKPPESDPFEKWSKECWGTSYDEKDNCIEFSCSFDLFGHQDLSNKMYIFDEYRYALRRIVAAYETQTDKRCGVLLGGHSGIGSSF